MLERQYRLTGLAVAREYTHRIGGAGCFRTPATAAAAGRTTYKRLHVAQQLKLIDISNFLNIIFYEILHEYFFVRNQFLMRKK